MGIQVQIYENAIPSLGACICVQAGGRKILLDCGLKTVADKPIQFPFNPKEIDAVIISHGHLGHCGLLPLLCRQSFDGRVYCTPRTKELAMLSMTEAAAIRQEQQDNPVDTFYTAQDVRDCACRFQPLDYYSAAAPCDGLTLTLYNAGHVGGSAIIKLTDSSGPQTSSLLYLADVGLQSNDLSHPDMQESQYDTVIVSALEKPKDSWQSNRKRMAAIINQAVDKSGNILFSVFSADQRQKLLAVLNELTAANQIPLLFVFLDTPAAEESHNYLAAMKTAEEDYPLLKLIGPQEVSKTLNSIRGSAIIISGMRHQTSGRMVEHLQKNLPDPNSAVVFVGNQLEGTPNRRIQQGEKRIKLNGCDCPVAAAIHTLYDPDLHLDRQSFTVWLNSLKSSPQLIELAH